MTTLPTDLQELLEHIEHLDRAADVLVDGLTDEQFHWQPDEGRSWSIGQCLDHLATANRVYGEAMRGAVDAARVHGWAHAGPIRSNAIGRRFVASLEPPVKFQTKAPSKIRPRSADGRDAILRRYHEAHALIRQLVMDCASIDVNRATFKNPFLPLVRVRVGTGLRIIRAHDRRHLWQADRVRSSPGFPTP